MFQNPLAYSLVHGSVNSNTRKLDSQVLHGASSVLNLFCDVGSL